LVIPGSITVLQSVSDIALQHSSSEWWIRVLFFKAKEI